MSGFEVAFAAVLGVEGDYSNDTQDSGGATRYGITEAVARANGYTGPMSALPLEEAKRIARAQYWDVLRLDAVDALSASIAHELFDTGYNMGVSVAGQFLQRALNALNRNGADYPDVAVDGVIGPMTVAALRSFHVKRGGLGELVMMRALNVLQGARYIEIAERRVKDEAFVFGWLANRVSI